MNGRYQDVLESNSGDLYQIKVKGTLAPYWSERLGGMAISSSAGETTISGQIIDQAALHGLLMQIRDLGLQLLLVEQIEPEERTENNNIEGKQ